MNIYFLNKYPFKYLIMQFLNILISFKRKYNILKKKSDTPITATQNKLQINK